MPAPSMSHPTAVARVAVFLALAYTIQFLVFGILQPFGLFIGATLGVFAGGVIATVLGLRIYRSGTLSDIGLAWHPAAFRHWAVGMLLGAGAAAAVAGIPILIGQAHLVPSAEYPYSLPGMFLVGVVLLFGALGEELIFRGYPFQMLAGRYGTYQILLPAAVLFATAHAGNPDSTHLALFNTFLWGVFLGYALIRSGDLWLPTAIHFGWNFTLPLFGVNLSGFRMGLTGQTLQWSAGELWSGGNYGPEAGIPTTLIVVALFFALHRVRLVHQQLPLMPEPAEGEEEELEA